MFLRAGLVSLALLLASRLLGLLRESVQAAALGAGAAADVAVLMLTLPDLLTGILASGALAYVLLPLWARQTVAAQDASQRRVARALLAAGAIGSPAILLGSEIPDPHNLVGRRTFLHPTVVSGALMPSPVEGYYGAPQTVYSDHFLDSTHTERLNTAWNRSTARSHWRTSPTRTSCASTNIGWTNGQGGACHRAPMSIRSSCVSPLAISAWWM